MALDLFRHKREAVFQYRSREKEGQIVNGTFRIIDEVRDCLKLFDRLNDTLTQEQIRRHHAKEPMAPA